MANSAEAIKQRYGDPFNVVRALERAAAQGFETLTEDDFFMCKWLGLYTHRHEQGYFMLRTKQPNGFVTPEQLDTIAEIAEKQQKGYADITTRQDFQLHWVRHTEALQTLKRLEAVGITTRGACGDITRNVVGCPVAGVDREEILDAGPLALEVSNFFVSDPAYADLPRKYKISLSGCRTQCIHPEIQCLAFVGATRTVNGQTEVGFDVRVGGGLSTQPFISQRLNAFVKPQDVLEVARRVTEIWRDSPEYREKRHHARFKYLIHDWGVPKFRQALEERLGRKLDEAPADYQEPADAYRDHVGVHAQKQRGLYYVGAPVLVGRITSPQMHKVADLSRRYGDGKTIRLTNRQNILLLNVPEANVEKVLAALGEVGLSVNAHPIRRSVVTCTGTEFCKLAITETKARSRQVTEYLEKRVPLDEPLRLHITGCPNACAQYQVANIGLMGSKTKVDGQVVDAYDICVGGQLGSGAAFNHAIVRKVPATECAKRLEQLLLGFKRQRKERESFNAWCKRIGDQEVLRLLTEGAAHPLAEADEVPVPKVPESDGPVY
ncbi:MAG: ferredoxin--nitrite reductase [Candidatus Omnitrophica bacterium CG11_big_fil_rev_8_21_14_0_20_63_9]|nr:MAG: ferredoxin--nitrite reductase [Candidatus Omnitrophica bacterium CG11_big_fil_rev_8_21_14_0_20_63_9]